MPIAEINGTQLFYKKLGNGPPILIMHGGFGVDHTYCIRMLEPLHSSFECIYYDMREHGRSQRTEPGEFTFNQLADDADALRQHLRYEKITILGHSAGGWIAQLYALKYQNHLDKLILIHTNYENPQNYSEEMKRMSNLAFERHPKWAARYHQFKKNAKDHPPENPFKEEWKHLIFNYLYKYNDEIDALWREILDRIRFNERAFKQGGKELSLFNTYEDLHTIRVPTLVTTGVHDLNPVSQSEVIASKIPNSHLKIFENMGHFAGLEDPEFYDVIRKFMKN